MAHKRIRNGRYYYTIVSKILPKGRTYLTFDDELEGDDYVKKLEAILKSGKIPVGLISQARAIETIEDAINAYMVSVNITDSEYSLLRVAATRHGKVTLNKVNYVWTDFFIDGMKAIMLSPSTIRHHVGALARCFDWLVRRGDTLLTINPLRGLPRRYSSGHKEEHERDRRLSHVEELEVRRILDGGKPKNRQRAFTFEHAEAMPLIFELAIESGMRLSEIFTLDIDQIDLPNKTIHLEKTKNGDKRQVPLTSVAIKALVNYLELDCMNGKKAMFSFEGRQKQVSSKLSQTFGRVFDAADCGDFTFHGLRHEATCRLYEKTKLSDLKIAKILGWKSLKMALRYTHLRASDLAEELW